MRFLSYVDVQCFVERRLLNREPIVPQGYRFFRHSTRDDVRVESLRSAFVLAERQEVQRLAVV